MTHVLDASALLAHYLGENGAERVQSLFEDESLVHRDPHFAAIPGHLLKQDVLPTK